uniref:Maternal embryonic leucine zipper kinase (inferred by orthology to a human protein) n=1 Tax=Strongyloides venezuelensis TaxID=75913 RepID=A0A0K0F4G8_STRVS
MKNSIEDKLDGDSCCMTEKCGEQLFTISPNETEEKGRQNSNQLVVGRTTVFHSKFSPIRKLVFSVLHTNKTKHYSIASMSKNDNKRPLFIWNNCNNQNDDDKSTEDEKKNLLKSGKKKHFLYYIKPKSWFKRKAPKVKEVSRKDNKISTDENSNTSSNCTENDFSKYASFMCFPGEPMKTVKMKTFSLPLNNNIIKSKNVSQKFYHDDKKKDGNLTVEQFAFPKVSGYQITKHIAYGGFSSVYKAKHLLTSVSVAIKNINIQKMASDNGKIIDNGDDDDGIPFHEKYEKELKMLRNEKSILQKMNHKHIVKLFQVIESPDLKYFTLVTELCDGLDLFDEILQNGAFNYNDTRHIYSQFILGLHYLHTHNIAHLDLKPENIIVSKTGHVKIIDFGMALEFTYADTTMASLGDLKVDEVINDSNRHKIKIIRGCGTLKYMGPEILKSEPFNPFQADIWASGLILYVMIKGSFLFDGAYKDDVLEEIRKKFDVIRAKSYSPHTTVKRGGKRTVNTTYLCHTRYPISTPTKIKIKNHSPKCLYFTHYRDIDDLLVNMLRVHPYRRWDTDQIICKADFIIKDPIICYEIEKRKERRKKSSKTSLCGLMGQIRTDSICDLIVDDKVKLDDKRLKQMKALGYCAQSTKESIKNNLYDTPHSIYNLLGFQQQQKNTSTIIDG